MAPVTRIRLTVDPVLDEFFATEASTSSDIRRRRLAAAERDLRRCLDAEAETLLTEPEQHLLDAERQFGAEGATARVAEPDALLLVLPSYLDDARWHGRDLEDRRLRTRLAVALAHHVVHLPEMRHLEVQCAVWDLDAAVERSRAATRTLKAV